MKKIGKMLSMELYISLETLLTCTDINKKMEFFKEFYGCYRRGEITRKPQQPVRIFDEPSYREVCTVIDPKSVPRRTKLHTINGQKLLLHAIAHIEYSAIDLALDAVYRFRDCGEAFELDWLEVADDEVRHFEMIVDVLKEIGGFYGEYPVHDALFEASMRTLELKERMAVVPRYLEANGLDATPQILKKLYPHRRDRSVEKIINALYIILDEEIGHVRKGDRWFEFACDRSGSKRECYFEIIEKHYPQSFPRKIEINCSARKNAGFSIEELMYISSEGC